MNKKDIIDKLIADRESVAYLINQKYASDGKVFLLGKLEYIESLLERIIHGGNV